MCSRIGHLAKSVQLGRFGPRNLMMFSAYFDSSGKAANSQVITVVGSLSPIERWLAFEKQWSSILARCGIRVFHMTDFVASRGEFRGWKGHSERRRELIEDLVTCAACHILHTYSYSIDVGLWKQFNAKYALEEQWGRPNVLVSLMAISSIVSHGNATNRRPIEFVFEMGEESFGGLFKKAKAMFDVEIVLRSKEMAIPCQVADIIAWKHRDALSKTVTADPLRDRSGDLATMKSLLLSISILNPIPHMARALADVETMEMWCAETNVPMRVK